MDGKKDWVAELEMVMAYVEILLDGVRRLSPDIVRRLCPYGSSSSRMQGEGDL